MRSLRTSALQHCSCRVYESLAHDVKLLHQLEHICPTNFHCFARCIMLKTMRGSRQSRPTMLLIALSLTGQAHAAEPADIWSRLDPSKVCPLASVWHMRVGTAGPPIEIIETIVPLQVDDRAVWRITRAPLRAPEAIRVGGGPDYDFVDLDRSTLTPLQSEHRGQGRAGPGAVTYYKFGTEAVQRLNTDASVAERVVLQAGQRPIVIADGPGAAAIYQAVRWSDDLQLRGYMVDRWHGRENQRLRPIDVSVTGRSSVEIDGRRLETYVVAERPLDGSYRMISQVTIERPHRAVRVEYYHSSNKDPQRPSVSQVATLMQDASCTLLR
jgi:hypothetical protein